jgi:enterochelin esterase-like enzyme
MELPYLRQPIHFGVLVRYAHGPDSFPQPGVPTGTTTEHALDSSKVFPETQRRYWVCVPAQYDGSEPASLMIFQDGNRNVEYDAFSDAYATFLANEILPAVQARCRISEDPNDRAIGGGSSGGSCAFTAAWTRPDLFRRVLSLLGSFAQLEGGNRYPTLIATEATKPLRIFMQAATRDLGWNEPEG